MKKYLYSLLALSAAATLALSCEKEMETAEDVDNAGAKLVNINIPVEIEAFYNPEDAETRTQYSNDFKTFGWTYLDQVRMPVVKFSAEEGITACDFYTFTTTDDSGSAEATFIRNGNSETADEFDPNPGLAADTWTSMGYLIYPADLFNKEHSGNFPVVDLPTSYDVNMAAPLDGNVALIGRKDGEKYKFSSAVGIIKVTLDNTPGDLSAVRLVSTGKPVAGKFAVSDVSETVSQIANTSATDGSQAITLNIASELTAGESYAFYFPLPVGTYDARTLKLQVIHKDTWNQEEILLEQTISKELKVKRNQLMELPSLLYHRVYIKHNNPSEPWLYTVKPESASKIIVHVTREKLTPATYDNGPWKSSNCFSGATASFNIASLTNIGGQSFLDGTGTYYLQYIVSKDGSIPSDLSDESILAFGSVPFYYRAVENKVAVTSEMLNVPYVSTAEGAVANLVDGNISTYWHSPYGSEDPARNATYGQIISIDLGAENTVGSFDFYFATRTCLNDHAKELDIYTSTKRWDEEGATLTKVGSTTDALKFLRPNTYSYNGEWVEAIPCTATKSYRYITVSIVKNSSDKDLRAEGCTHMAEMALYQTTTLTPSAGDEPDAIDLGLSVKWASFNVGATTPTQCGNYYAWGEVKTKTNYSWAKYKWSQDGTTTQITKYVTKSDYAYLGATDGKVTLDPEDDIANVKYGGNWRMPTMDEWKELISSCSKTWVLDNGMWGWRFTASNENSIFLPAAGGYNLAKLESVGTYDNEEDCYGFYWSSTLNSNNPIDAYYVEFCLDWVETTYSASRARGFSVRAVYAE